MQASHDAHGTVLDSLEDALTSHEIKSASSLVRAAFFLCCAAKLMLHVVSFHNLPPRSKLTISKLLRFLHSQHQHCFNQPDDLQVAEKGAWIERRHRNRIAEIIGLVNNLKAEMDEVQTEDEEKY